MCELALGSAVASIGWPLAEAAKRSRRGHPEGAPPIPGRVLAWTRTFPDDGVRGWHIKGPLMGACCGVVVPARPLASSKAPRRAPAGVGVVQRQGAGSSQSEPLPPGRCRKRVDGATFRRAATSFMVMSGSRRSAFAC